MMRVLCLLLCTFAFGFAAAQAPEPDRPADTEQRETRQASREAIDIEALQPAVDVSRTVDPTPRRSSAATSASPSRVMDSLDLGTTSITGNQELPKVLYIVPWKRSDLGDLIGRPVNTLLNEVLAPIDPVVFERHLSYYDTLYGESQQE